ncbi:MAG: gliding motility protein GldL [Bernardetiaceae bacterium]
MSFKEETSLQRFYRVVVPKATSFGAAIVVLGALFKIQHFPGAGIMLMVGLGVESLIFLLGVFEPPQPFHPHYDWEKVYPELMDDTVPAIPAKKEKKQDPSQVGTAVLVGLDAMLSEANLSTDAFKKFGQGIQSLNDTAGRMKDMGDAVVATKDYAKNVGEASKSLTTLNQAYSGTVKSMQEMANASKDAKEYHSQVQVITKNLGALNAVYEMELKDANTHLKAMNKFYSNLTSAMSNMADASKESEAFKQQMGKLTTNITNLNTIYGNMLTAMRGK